MERQHAATLRDKSGTTRLLVLTELHHDPSTLSELANRLGITVQAVSTYARALAADGHLSTEASGYRVTPSGLQLLHEGARQLRNAVNRMADSLADMTLVSAVARGSIRRGERVGLAMVGGDLEARRLSDERSAGHAHNDAREGQEVLVGELTGIVPLTPGTLTVVAVPGPSDGGIIRVNRLALRQQLPDTAHHVGAVGTGARILARSLGSLDLDFAAEQAAFNAAERGLDVHLYVSRDRLPDVLKTLDKANGQTLQRVPVRTHDAPLEAP